MSALIGSKRGVDVGIVMNDCTRMLHFYGAVLGLQYVEHIPIPWGTMHRFRFGESWLKLVDPVRDPGATPPAGIDAASGLRYITFEIDEIAEAWSRAIDGGATVFHDLGQFGTAGITMGMLFDPDGNVVELLHRPPTAAVDS